MSERKYYCFCDSNCKFETMTKEQILAAIVQAVETGAVQDVDTGFVTKLKETNGGGYVTAWVGTRAQYNALAEHPKNCIWVITDDTTEQDIEQLLARFDEDIFHMNEAIYSLTPTDITDKMEFVKTTVVHDLQASDDAMTGLTVTEKKFTYSPAAGSVFFSMAIEWETAALSAGDTITFKTGGSYVPSIRHISNIGDFLLKVYGNLIQLKANTDITWQGNYLFNGWYHCDGE